MSLVSIELTDSESGSVFSIGEGSIISVIAEGSGSKISYSNKGAGRKQAIVDEAPAAIEGAGSALIEVTDRESGLSEVINAERIISFSDDSDSKAIMEYDAEGAGNKRLILDEDQAAVQALVDAL